MSTTNKIELEETERLSHNTLTHVKCLHTGLCQETEGFKGTPHEGVDMCEDGCVWYNPRTNPNKRK